MFRKVSADHINKGIGNYGAIFNMRHIQNLGDILNTEPQGFGVLARRLQNLTYQGKCPCHKQNISGDSELSEAVK